MIVKTTWFPFGDYDAMTVWPFIFVKGDVNEVVISHEKIHFEQQKELMLVGFYAFYVLYTLFFIVKFIWLLLSEWDKSFQQAWDETYYWNPFEKEAYEHEKDVNYYKTRKHYAWLKYFK